MKLFDTSLLPGKAEFFMDTAGQPVPYFCEELQLFYVLTGSAELHSLALDCTLRQNDFAVVNPYERYSLCCGEDTALLILRVCPELVQSGSGDPFQVCCCSVGRMQSESCNAIRRLLAQLLQWQGRGTRHSDYLVLGRLYELLDILKTCFRQVSYAQVSGIGRAAEIIRYVRTHAMEDCTLSETAGALYVTPNYISKLFRKVMDTTFTDYVSAIRAEEAKRQLRTTSKTVTQIALDCGFKNVKSIISYFKAHVGMTPTEYKRTSAPTEHTVSAVENSALFAQLLAYAEPSAASAQPLEIAPDEQNISADWRSAGRRFHPNWNAVISMGSAKEGLLGPVQEQLRHAQQTIGFRYLHFHGLLDDAMHVYSEDIDGSPIYSFSFVDALLDFALSIHMRPYLEFSYIPSALARDAGTDKRYCNSSGILSYPKSLTRWRDLIDHLVRHCIARYGLQEVLQWRFALMGYNHTFFQPWIDITREEYFVWSELTYRTLKQIDSRLKFGGPTTEGTTVLSDDSDSFEQYFRYCKEHDCVPDFCAFHFYPHDFEHTEADFDKLFTQQSASPIELLDDPNAVSTMLDRIQIKLAKLGLEHLELVLDKWNSTVWQHDLCNDTAYKGAFIAKTALENMHCVSMMGYGLYSDFVEELPPRETFYGGHGVVTYNGLYKPGYWVMRLLTMLRGRVLQQGDGYYLMKDDRTIYAVFYNYCSYSSMYRHSYMNEENRIDRYSMFQDADDRLFRVQIHSYPAENVMMKSWLVGREHGSVFDRWIEIGSPEIIDAEIAGYLNQLGAPLMKVSRLPVKEHTLDLSAALHPHDVMFIEIVPDAPENG